MDSNRLPNRRSWMVGMTMPKTSTTGMRGICRMLRPYIRKKLRICPISATSGALALAVTDHGAGLVGLPRLGLREPGAGVLEEDVLQGRGQHARLAHGYAVVGDDLQRRQQGLGAVLDADVEGAVGEGEVVGAEGALEVLALLVRGGVAEADAHRVGADGT